MIAPSNGVQFPATAEVLIVGAGAAGLIAALSAKASGAEPVLIERDAIPTGSTGLSAGLIPAAGTVFQARQGVVDDPQQFRADILAKSHGLSNATVLDVALDSIGPTLEWLGRVHGLPFDVITDFRYPGHSQARMHALPRRTGQELIDHLRAAVERAGITLLNNARVTTLLVDQSKRVDGVEILRMGQIENIGCQSLVLACNGYGGNQALVADYVPHMSSALWFGHSGNEGDAVRWGQRLGAELRDMSGHQGHGSVATPHGILITWATMSEGGVQVNADGLRFSDESRGYSEQGAIVLGQPGGVAWSLFDGRIAAIAAQFEDFRNATSHGAILTAQSVVELAAVTGLPMAALTRTMSDVDADKASGAPDGFGRTFAKGTELQPPFHAVKVTGALFHTQGGLAINRSAQVLLRSGQPLPNLFAAGGAAVGVSGPEASGYLSGNGLLTAVALGRVAGIAASRQITRAG